jgi:5'(3')-deoxyribonucleotidase
MKNLRHCLLDVDEVVCDFFSTALPILAERAGRPDVTTSNYPFGEWNMGGVFPDLPDHPLNILDEDPDFWLNLPALPWAQDLYRHLCRLFGSENVTFATSPTRGVNCASHKLLWLHRQFGVWPDSVMIGSRKHLMAHPDVVLVDDRPGNVEAFRQAGGRAVLFPAAWNTFSPRFEEPVGYTLKTLCELDART